MRPALLLCVIAAGGCSLRQMERWQAGGDLELDSRAIRRDSPVAGGEPDDVVDAGLGLRAQGGPGKLGIALGLDLHLGGGTDGGFAYETALRPLGVGLALGSVGGLTLTAGAGVAGVTGRVPFTFRLPLEARLDVDLNRRVHVRMFTELDGLAHDDLDPLAGRGHDLRGGFLLRLGKGGDRYRERWGNGGFVGVIAGEQRGVRELGLVIGYGITDRYVPAGEPIGL